MRPNQQNKNRSRGRSNNNSSGRKHSNPLSRNYESNGPDVKIRGNASHIAEKYVQLARDAQSSGDSVMAENYFQHAEHYFRLLSVAQSQMPVRQDQVNETNTDDDDTEHEEEMQQSASPQRSASSDQVTDVDAEADQPAVVAESKESGDENSEQRSRSRRPRRRKFSEGEKSDPGAAPQPDVGELPAFLTNGGTASAAE